VRAETLGVAQGEICAAMGALEEALKVKMPDKAQVSELGVGHADAN
jgi:hypothetical protein